MLYIPKSIEQDVLTYSFIIEESKQHPGYYFGRVLDPELARLVGDLSNTPETSPEKASDYLKTTVLLELFSRYRYWSDFPRHDFCPNEIGNYETAKFTHDDYKVFSDNMDGTDWDPHYHVDKFYGVDEDF